MSRSNRRSTRAGEAFYPSNDFPRSLPRPVLLDSSRFSSAPAPSRGFFTPPKASYGPAFAGPRIWAPPPKAKAVRVSPGRYPSAMLGIRVPVKVRFCVQRQTRREVLFAMRRAGYRGSAPKRRYRRTQNSQYSC